MRVSKIDLACRDPRAMAEFFGKVFLVQMKLLGADCYGFDLEGVEVCFVSKSAAGVAEAAEGTQQMHLCGGEEPAGVAARAGALGARTEAVDDARGVCIWDPEGNPWIFTR